MLETHICCRLCQWRPNTENLFPSSSISNSVDAVKVTSTRTNYKHWCSKFLFSFFDLEKKLSCHTENNYCLELCIHAPVITCSLPQKEKTWCLWLKRRKGYQIIDFQKSHVKITFCHILCMQRSCCINNITWLHSPYTYIYIYIHTRVYMCACARERERERELIAELLRCL